MATISRRKLLARTSMGAAAAGVLTAVPGIIAAKHHSGPTASSSATTITPNGDVPSVAYVRDAKKGEVVLMVGTREVIHTDPALVAYLTRAYHRASA